jgi:MFS family permease
MSEPSHASDAAALDADVVYRKVAWRLMPFLVLCYFAAFLDRSNVGYAKLQFMGDLGFSEAVYGLGAGLFYAGYMLFEVPSNLYLQSRGVRKTLLRIMVLWGLASAAMALMRTANEFYLLRALLGAAEAGFFPGILLYLTFWIPPRRRARFTSLFTISIAISGVIGGPIAGAVMSAFEGLAGLRGWQWLFLVEGLPSCLLGVMAYFYLNDGPAQAPWLTAQEKALIASDLASESGVVRNRHTKVGTALRDPRFLLLMVMAFALFAGVSGVFLWLPTILRDGGVTGYWNIGLLSAIPFSAGAVVMYFNGRSSDRLFERRWHTAVPAMVGALGWALLPSVMGRPWLSLAVLTLTTAGTLGGLPPFWTLPSAILSGTAAAAGIALVSTVGSLGSFVSPMLIGWLATETGSLASGQYYVATVMAVGVLALLAIGRPDTTNASATDRPKS